MSRRRPWYRPAEKGDRLGLVTYIELVVADFPA
jgi:hypothetical protein